MSLIHTCLNKVLLQAIAENWLNNCLAYQLFKGAPTGKSLSEPYV